MSLSEALPTTATDTVSEFTRLRGHPFMTSTKN